MSSKAQISLVKAFLCPWKLRQYFGSKNQQQAPVEPPIILEPEAIAHAACEVDTTPMPSGNEGDLVIKELPKPKEGNQERIIYLPRHPNVIESILLFSSGLFIGTAATMIATRADLQEQPGYWYEVPPMPGPELFRKEQIQNQGFEPNALNEDLIRNRENDYKALKEINDFTKRVPAVAKYAKLAVVFINSELRENIAYGSGTGFIYSSDDSGSIIVTNKHVVELPFGRIPNEVKVILINGRQIVGRVIGTDSQHDLALVKINETNLPTLGLSTEEPGAEFVIAIGNPQKLGWTTTLGIVSGVDRTLPGTNRKVLQTDAPLNPGNSGGPLVNMNGDVIAVNQSIITGFGQYQNLGFGIPARDVKNVIPKILSQPRLVPERLKGLKLPPDFFEPFNQGPFNKVPDLDKF